MCIVTILMSMERFVKFNKSGRSMKKENLTWWTRSSVEGLAKIHKL